MQPPPFPDVRELIDGSAWLGGRDGLREEAWAWHADVDPRREGIAAEAARLASPRIDVSTVVALARTTLRFVWFALTGAVGAVLARMKGDHPGPAAVRRAFDLVRAGGPAYVKAGQFIATAKGVLPDEWTDAFAWCRDEVPPLPPGTAEQAVAAAFGRSVGELFASFDPVPCAAASIAQVHAARLPDGTEVMVKVQRPGLRREFESSVRVMAVLGGIADRVSGRARIANIPGFVELFAQLVLEELDFGFEAVNMIDIGLANEGAGIEYCRIPRPIPGLISPAVLVMERVPGVRYTDARLGPGVDGRRIVRLAIQGVLEQALVYGVFHGDLHAGNVLIDETGDFSLVDFGIAGRVGTNERSALVRLVLAAARDDTAALVAAISEFGALPPDLDLDQAAREFDAHAKQLRALGDRPLDELDFTTLTDQFGHLLRLLASHRFRVPKDLVLFSKNLLYLNGLAATVAPDINLLAETEPVLGYFIAKYPEQMSTIAIDLLAQRAQPVAVVTP